MNWSRHFWQWGVVVAFSCGWQEGGCRNWRRHGIRLAAPPWKDYDFVQLFPIKSSGQNREDEKNTSKQTRKENNAKMLWYPDFYSLWCIKLQRHCTLLLSQSNSVFQQPGVSLTRNPICYKKCVVSGWDTVILTHSLIWHQGYIFQIPFRVTQDMIHLFIIIIIITG